MHSRMEFACTQARLQARFATLPGPAVWRHLAGARSLSAYLEEARSGPLQFWVASFSADSDGHAIDRGIRAQFCHCVAEVVRFSPPQWRPAVRWVEWWATLPLLPWLYRQSDPPRWAVEDPSLKGLLADAGRLDQRAFQTAGAEALFSALAAAEPLGTAWFDHWRILWPTMTSRRGDSLTQLVALIRRHLHPFPGLAPAQAWAAREALRSRLCNRFHRWLQQPANLFVYLALVGCDLERLRADLNRRALFPEVADG